MPNNSFGAASKLRAGDAEYRYFRLARSRRTASETFRACPSPPRSCSRICCATKTASAFRAADVEYVARGARRRRQRNQLHAGARAAAGFHRRAVRGGPGGHARRPGRHGRRPQPRQPAAARRPGDRPLRAGGPLRLRGRLRVQRAARVPAQPRALHPAALGPDGVPQFPRGAARYRHRAPGEPGISGAGGVPRRRPGLPRFAWWARTPTPP